MHFDGIGRDHGREVHHVTNCMHDHAHYRKEESGASSASSGAASQAVPEAPPQPEGQFSLSAWLEKTLGNGKRLLKSIWGSSEAVGDGTRTDGAQALMEGREGSAADVAGAGPAGGESHVPDPAGILHPGQVAAASTAVAPPGRVEENPYFAPVNEAGGQEKGIWQKIKVKFKDVTGQLTGHLPGNFFNTHNKDSFQAKQEKPKEDLRKHSKFRGDKLEIDCILTDDSYLLDSYDRKGEYSRLSAK